jgi:hypothetical protein
MANGQQQLFEIPVIDADTGESFSIFSDSQEPLSDADFDALLQAQVPPAAAQAAQEVPGLIQREGPAAALSAGLPMLATGVAGPAGLAARGALAAGGAVLGRTGSTLATEGRLPTRNELLFEGLGSLVPETVSSLAVDPSDAFRLFKAVGGKLDAAAGGRITRSSFGQAFKREMPKLRAGVTKEVDGLFNPLRRKADALGVRAPVGNDTQALAEEALQRLPAAGLTDQELAAAENAISDFLATSTGGGEVPFSQLMDVRLRLNEALPNFNAKNMSPDERIFQQFTSALRSEQLRQATGTPLDKSFRAANRALEEDITPLRLALRNIGRDTTSIDDVMTILTNPKQPTRLKKVFSRLDEPLRNKLRASYFNDLLTTSSDVTGIVDISKVASKFRTQPPSTRRLLAGGSDKDAAEVTQMFKRLESLSKNAEFTQKVMNQVVAVGSGAGIGALVGTAMAGEDGSQDLTSIIFAVGAGIGGMAMMSKILSTPSARIALQRGLSGPKRLSTRFAAQALSRAGLDR